MSNASATRRQFLADAGIAAATTAALGTTAAIADEAGSDAAVALAWLGEALAVIDADCTETLDCEVLVCDAGDADMFCALAATEAGAEVLLVDPMEQGFGIRCGALGTIDSKLQQATDVAIDKVEIVNDITHYADGACDMRIWSVLAAS